MNERDYNLIGNKTILMGISDDLRRAVSVEGVVSLEELNDLRGRVSEILSRHFTAIEAEELGQEEPEEYLEECPECHRKSLRFKLQGGVECTFSDCGYWFCF